MKGKTGGKCMSKRILRWFGDFRNEIVLGMVREHLELTESAVNALFNLVRSACDSPEEKKALYDKISEFEMRADQLRRDMIVKLTERDVFPNEREDLMELVRAVDWVADWAREAGRILIILPFENAPDEVKQSAMDMSKACTKAVSLLSDCIEALSEDRMKAIGLADQVEMIEEDVDDLYSEARRHIATLEFQGFSDGALILLNEFFDALETVADWCENTVDIVRAIAIRGK
jgi:predicted phosphate transport protein (TIGR00153 family)